MGRASIPELRRITNTSPAAARPTSAIAATAASSTAAAPIPGLPLRTFLSLGDQLHVRIWYTCGFRAGLALHQGNVFVRGARARTLINGIDWKAVGAPNASDE